MAIAFMIVLSQQSKNKESGKYFLRYLSLDWFHYKVRLMSSGWALMLLVDSMKLADALGRYPA